MSEQQKHTFVFSGRGGEYFRIWMVNMLLTVLTLGVYSAWATVRTKRWFYGHTHVDGQAFVYLAEPLQLLKGRLIALVLLAVYALLSHFMPQLAWLLLLAAFVATPWLMLSSLRFNARMSAYRGIRFDFGGTLREALVVYLLLPALLPFTLGLIWPYMRNRQMQFFSQNSQWGDAQGAYEGGQSAIWAILGAVLAIVLLPVTAGAFAFKVLFAGHPAMGLALLAAPLGIYPLMLLAAGYGAARFGNLFFNQSRLGPIGFDSRLRARGMVWLYVSNLVLMAITLGLFFPWARVRLARYRAECLSLRSSESLDTFAGGMAHAVKATGAELADAFDVGAGIV